MKKAGNTATSALLTITCGITSIGHILAGIGSSSSDELTDIVESQTLADIGYLVESLGEMAQDLNHSLGDINYTRAQHSALTGKPV